MAVRHGDPIGLAGVEDRFVFGLVGGRLRHRRVFRCSWCQDVRDREPCRRLDEREVVGRQSVPVQSSGKGADPAVTKGVKESRIDSGPVVNRHGESSARIGYPW